MDQKVLIAVPTAEYARRADFYDHLDLMDKPIGTVQTKVHGQSPAAGRNVCIRGALERDCTHILFIDDDVIVPQDLLTRLLKHDKDIVSGLYLMRNYPHSPIIFNWSDEKGHCRHNYLTPETQGLIEIVAAGLGACLIKTDVFRALEEPWIRLGELDPQNWCDDIGFFKRVREKGFKLFCDLDAWCGHIGSMVIRPRFDKELGKWMTDYDTAGKGQASLYQAYPETTVK